MCDLCGAYELDGTVVGSRCDGFQHRRGFGVSEFEGGRGCCWSKCATNCLSCSAVSAMLSFEEVALLPWCECSTAVAISANFMMIGGAHGGQEGIGSWCDGGRSWSMQSKESDDV